MTIEVEPAEEQKLLKKAAQRISKQVQIPGFRPGKAPYNTVVRRYGLETVQQEVLEHASEKIINDALKDADLEPQAPMSLDDVSWEPLILKVKVPTKPIVELGEYRNIRLESKPVEVTDEDVDKALEKMQEQRATWVPVERASKPGDLLTFSVTEKDGDEVLNQEESVEYELVEHEEEEDNATERPDFTTPLLGLSAGENKVFTISYPDNYQAERYAGKEITFEVEVGSVKEKELDPLDDDFAQETGEFETLDALKEQLYSSIEHRRQHEIDHELGHEVLDKIMQDAKLEWPEALEIYRIAREIEGIERQLERSGLTLESYLQMQNKSEDEFREETRERVVNDIKTGLVLNELSKLEQLEVNQVEILERARAIGEMSGVGDQFWQSVLSSSRSQATIASDLLTDKIFARLAAIARNEAPEPGAESAAEDEAGAVTEVEAAAENFSAVVEVPVGEEGSTDEDTPAQDEAPSAEGTPSEDGVVAEKAK
jgi:trigger factor